jgi:hypothetical protein
MCKAVQFRSNSQHTGTLVAQPDHPATCVVAQQYSPTTAALLCFHSRTEKFGSHFNNITSTFFRGFGKLLKSKISVWECLYIHIINLNERGTLQL